jgi:hypothetical protein
VGDPKEAEGISAAFFPSVKPPGMIRSEADRVYVGSIKTVVGNYFPLSVSGNEH